MAARGITPFVFPTIHLLHNTIIQCSMGTLNIQVGFNPQRQDDLATVRKIRGVPSNASDESVVKTLLFEKIDEVLRAGSKTAKK